MKKNIVIFVALGLIFFSSVQAARAENQTVGLSVDQAVFNLALWPQESAEFPVTLENVSAQKEQVTVAMADAVLGKQNQLETLATKNDLYGLAEWLTPEVNNFFLAPGEKRTVQIKINVPEKATVGSHYGAVVFRALPEINGENFQEVVVGGQLAVMVLTNVKGEISGQGTVKNFSAPVFSNKEVALTAEFENEGNIHYIPHGEIAIRNLLSRRVQSLELAKHFVFPGQSFTFEADWSLPSLFGIYVAEAAFVDGNGVAHTARRVIVGDWAFVPWLLLLALIITFGKMYYGRRHKRK